MVMPSAIATIKKRFIWFYMPDYYTAATAAIGCPCTVHEQTECVGATCDTNDIQTRKHDKSDFD
jgi:hypothetical protein